MQGLFFWNPSFNLLLSALIKLWEFPNSISISNLNVNNHQLFTLSWQKWFLSAKYPLQIQHLQFTIRCKKCKYQTGLQHASTMHCQLLRTSLLPDHSEQPPNTKNVQGLVTNNEQILASPSAGISDGFTGTTNQRNYMNLTSEPPPRNSVFPEAPSCVWTIGKRRWTLEKIAEKKVQTSLIKEAKNLGKSAIVEIETSRISGSHFRLWNPCPEFQKCQAPS